MISFDDARALLLARARPLSAERVPLEAAAGRVLAEDLVARAPLPRFDHSAMDGYALATSALGAAPFELRVIGRARPARGRARSRRRGREDLHRGAHAERRRRGHHAGERRARGDRIRFEKAPRPGENVRTRGFDMAEGARAIERGTRLRPGHVALAAALDRPSLLVSRAPVVTILGTGDELRAPGDPDRAGSIPESNGYFVSAAARGVGAIARIGRTLPDELETAASALDEALASADVLVTIGGVSVGDRDVVKDALAKIGVTLEFHKVAMKPGKPMTFGTRGSAIVLGLPGNPASASLTFALFGVPLLRALQGEAPRPMDGETVEVVGRIPHKPGRREFARVRLRSSQGELVAEVCPNQSSGSVPSFAEAEALVVVHEGLGDVESGARLPLIRLDGI
ncbi:MAG: molybdopterin molybdotransferase MoeA [Polyangiaceae bacterium]